MRASTYSLVSLSQFAGILGLDPLHFAGGYSALRPVGAHCHDLWMQYQWQDPGKASREEIARVLKRAEEDVADLCGYYAAWKWIADERHKLDRGGLSPHIRATRLVTKRKHVLSGGIQATSDIDAGDVTRGANIDADGDTFAETAVFTITNVPATWGLEEIRACFNEYTAPGTDCRTDPSSEGYDEAWEVRPLKPRRSGATTVMVYIPVWHLFRPQLYEELNPSHINANDVLNYVDTLTFYRVYNDPSIQVSFMWGTDCVYDVSCAWAIQAGCIRTPDPRTGIVTVAPGAWDVDHYDATRFTYGTVPDAVRLWYRAGLARPAPGIVDHRMARLIVILACARLDYPICSCGNPQTLVADWRENAAKATKVRSFMLTPQMISNVLGTRVGEIMVWSALNLPSTRVGKAVKT